MTTADPRFLHLSFPIPEIFNTPEDRHQYGDLMANYLKSALRIMGSRTTVMYEIVTTTGEKEGPDGQAVTGRNAI